MDSPVQFLNSYVLNRASDEPLPVRAKLYRALAAVAGDKQEAGRLVRMARGLEAIERRHRQLALNFGKGGPAS